MKARYTLLKTVKESTWDANTLLAYKRGGEREEVVWAGEGGNFAINLPVWILNNHEGVLYVCKGVDDEVVSLILTGGGRVLTLCGKENFKYSLESFEGAFVTDSDWV